MYNWRTYDIEKIKKNEKQLYILDILNSNYLIFDCGTMFSDCLSFFVRKCKTGMRYFQSSRDLIVGM